MATQAMPWELSSDLAQREAREQERRARQQAALDSYVRAAKAARAEEAAAERSAPHATVWSLFTRPRSRTRGLQQSV